MDPAAPAAEQSVGSLFRDRNFSLLATAMLPAIARDPLHADASALAMLRAAPAVGAAIISLILARYPLGRKVGAWMVPSLIAGGTATLIIALTWMGAFPMLRKMDRFPPAT